MKKVNRILTGFLIALLLVSCGSSGVDTSSKAENDSSSGETTAASVESADEEVPGLSNEESSDEQDTEPVEEKASANDENQTADGASNTVSAGGITVSIEGLHLTKDSNGDPIAAVEFLYTNENEEPYSFMSAVQMSAFQNGVELHKDEMFLERDYDWDTFYTEIKDGATITVFHALPLQNEDDPVELTVQILDFTTWTVAASTTLTVELTQGRDGTEQKAEADAPEVNAASLESDTNDVSFSGKPESDRNNYFSYDKPTYWDYIAEEETIKAYKIKEAEEDKYRFYVMGVVFNTPLNGEAEREELFKDEIGSDGTKYTKLDFDIDLIDNECLVYHERYEDNGLNYYALTKLTDEYRFKVVIESTKEIEEQYINDVEAVVDSSVVEY